MRTQRPKPPKIQKHHKTPRLHELCRKVRTNLGILHCDRSQEPSRICPEKLAQINFYVLVGFGGGGGASSDCRSFKGQHD